LYPVSGNTDQHQNHCAVLVGQQACTRWSVNLKMGSVAKAFEAAEFTDARTILAFRTPFDDHGPSSHAIRESLRDSTSHPMRDLTATAPK
jgi:hypothetical protein